MILSKSNDQDKDCYFYPLANASLRFLFNDSSDKIGALSAGSKVFQIMQDRFDDPSTGEVLYSPFRPLSYNRFSELQAHLEKCTGLMNLRNSIKNSGLDIKVEFKVETIKGSPVMTTPEGLVRNRYLKIKLSGKDYKPNVSVNRYSKNDTKDTAVIGRISEKYNGIWAGSRLENLKNPEWKCTILDSPPPPKKWKVKYDHGGTTYWSKSHLQKYYKVIKKED